MEIKEVSCPICGKKLEPVYDTDIVYVYACDFCNICVDIILPSDTVKS
nr:hypothetical protein DGKKSRWO_DGKKSRWO_CDS_0110 [uncultured phage]CAI9752287.1 hypothetical protein CVNMHQAP_CVNMHQAP_CDS_0110 [uncultured phage]